MNKEQIEAFTEFFESAWPIARSWPQETWPHWGLVLAPYGASYVRVGLSQLLRDPTWREFPPSLAAVVQAVEEAQASARADLSRAMQRLARMQEAGNDEEAAKVQAAIDQLEARLAP